MLSNAVVMSPVKLSTTSGLVAKNIKLGDVNVIDEDSDTAEILNSISLSFR